MRTVRVENSSYPDLVGLFGTQPIPTSFEYAVGAVSKPDGSKAVSHYLDPNPRYFGGMADGRPGWWDSSACFGYTLDQGSLIHTPGPGGLHVVQLDGSQTFRPPGGAVSRWNAQAASFVCAVRVSSAITGTEYLVGPTTGGASGSSYVTVSADRVSGNLGGVFSPYLFDPLEKWLVIVATFSVERGSAIRINGSQVISKPESTAPLYDGRDTSFYGGPGVTASVPGLVGHTMMLEVDLSSPEYAADLARIESQLCSMYQV